MGQAEKDLAKTRVEIAHEMRLAKEAEASMDLHVNKAAEKARRHESKHPDSSVAADQDDPYSGATNYVSHNQMFSDALDSTRSVYGGSTNNTTAAAGITSYPTNTTSSAAPTTK